MRNEKSGIIGSEEKRKADEKYVKALVGISVAELKMMLSTTTRISPMQMVSLGLTYSLSNWFKNSTLSMRKTHFEVLQGLPKSLSRFHPTDIRRLFVVDCVTERAPIKKIEIFHQDRGLEYVHSETDQKIQDHYRVLCVLVYQNLKRRWHFVQTFGRHMISIPSMTFNDV